MSSSTPSNQNNNNEDDDERLEVDLNCPLQALPRSINGSSNRLKNTSNNNNEFSDSQQQMNDSTSTATLGRKPSVRFNEGASPLNKKAGNATVDAATTPNKTSDVVQQQGSPRSALKKSDASSPLTKNNNQQKKSENERASASAANNQSQNDADKNNTNNDNENDDSDDSNNLVYEYGDLFAFEFLANARSESSSSSNNNKRKQENLETVPWAWGVGRQVTAVTRVNDEDDEDNENDDSADNLDLTTRVLLEDTRRKQKACLEQGLKRVMKLELWEVEAREDKLTKGERARLADVRRQIANTSQELIQLESQKKALDDSMRGADLSIAALESALAADFADVQDLLTNARRSLSNLKTEHFAEMRNYSKPPVTVRSVLECVLIALGDVTRDAVSWEQVKVAVRKEDFVLNIRDFEPSSLTQTSLKLLQNRLKDESFTLERARTASVAAGPLFQWITAQLECAKEAKRSKAYSDLSKQIAAHRRRSRQLTQESTVLNPKIEKLLSSISSLQSESDKILFGSESVSFPRNVVLNTNGKRKACSHTGLLLSSPFTGLTFVPQDNAPIVDMLKVACHRLGAADQLEPSPFVKLNADKCQIIRSAFDLPKVKVTTTTQQYQDSKTGNNNKAGSNNNAARVAAARRGASNNARGASNTARTSSNKSTTNNNNNNPSAAIAHNRGDYVLNHHSSKLPPAVNPQQQHQQQNAITPRPQPAKVFGSPSPSAQQQQLGKMNSPPRNLPPVDNNNNINSNQKTTTGFTVPASSKSASNNSNNTAPNNSNIQENDSQQSSSKSTPRSKNIALKNLNQKKGSSNSQNNSTTTTNESLPLPASAVVITSPSSSVMPHLLSPTRKELPPVSSSVVSNGTPGGKNNNNTVTSSISSPSATDSSAISKMMKQPSPPSTKKSPAGKTSGALSPRIARLAGVSQMGANSSDLM